MTNSIKIYRRREKNVNVAPDFLSNIPDNIIEEILRRLPIRDYVRTSVLSKKWRYKWTRIPHLIFDDRNCMKPSSTAEDLNERFANTIYHILAQHKGQIHKFKLSVFSCNSTYHHIAKYIDGYIGIVSKRGIRNLVIEIHLGLYKMRNSLYGCENLEVLKLKNCTIEIPGLFNGFKLLKELHLEYINITVKDFKSLISRCPLLEKLTFIKSEIHHFEVQCSNLKYLHVQGAFGDLHLENAEHIRYFGIHQSGYIQSVEGSQQKPNLKTVFASHLTGIRKLEVGNQSLEFFAEGRRIIPMCLPTMLDCLKDICMAIDFADLRHISAALCLIRSSPNLEQLRICEWLLKQRKPSVIKVINFWEEQRNAGTWRFNHLKIVKMEHCTCAELEVGFIRYILECSPSLERVILEVEEKIPDNILISFRQKLINIKGISSPPTQIEISKVKLVDTSRCLCRRCYVGKMGIKTITTKNTE